LLWVWYNKTIVKKSNILISLLSIAFFVIFLVVSSGANAETQEEAKKDLVSILHLEAVGLLGPVGTSGERKDREIASLRTSFVQLKEGLDAFINFTSPPHQGFTSKDSRTDYRAVVGLHFRLR
jgi:hypothetical protein